MVQDSHNVIPFSLAVLLHVVVFGSLIVVIDFGERSRPVVPLAISATLVTDNAIVIPPKVEEVAPPEPDISEQQRIRAEEQKRLEDQRIEQERLHRLAQEEEERKRKAAEEAERKRKAAAEAERKRKAQEEAEKERQRVEAERQRQAEIERQRQENERLRREAINAESQRVEAMAANAKAVYINAIWRRVKNSWVMPPTAVGTECVAHITQIPGGEVVSVRIGRCNGDETVRRSIEAAIYRASPLPLPADPSVFDRNINLTFRPEE